MSPEQCEEEFERVARLQREFDDRFNEHEKLEVFYEDLVADTVHQSYHLQEFLGVKLRRLKAATVKQNIRPLSEVVTNYDMLKAFFSTSEWACMFDE